MATWYDAPYGYFPDGEPQRWARHREVAEELLARGMAYRCYATQEDLAAMRERAGDLARLKGDSFAEDVHAAMATKCPASMHVFKRLLDMADRIGDIAAALRLEQAGGRPPRSIFVKMRPAFNDDQDEIVR